MNIPVPPFAKGGLGGIGFLPPLQLRLSIPPAPLGNPTPPFAKGAGGISLKGGKHSWKSPK